jgi:hypothetical protein
VGHGPLGWQVPALAVAGLAVLSATAFAGGERQPMAPARQLLDAAPAAAPVAAPSPSARPATAAPGRDVPVVDPGWLTSTARAAGLPRVALRAYTRAQLGSPADCGLGWTTLAGIGWVESQHGTIGGRLLRADGRPTDPILGPALDGAGDVAAIPADEAGTALHGDQVWDHAVGPMQFLASTWETWTRDGDGDGTADPQDLDDAAASAAAYLCADGHDLSGSGWAAAVLSYNHDAGYVGQVFTAAQAYADRTA